MFIDSKLYNSIQDLKFEEGMSISSIWLLVFLISFGCVVMVYQCLCVSFLSALVCH